MVGPGRDVGIINDEEAVCSFHMGIKHISMDPLISTNKRRPQAPSFQQHTREEEHQRSRSATPLQWA
jgi:hypothetical protein